MTALPNRDRRAERREATRREIVDTAWDIARADGLAAVTLREIAARIGMRPPSLYSHFESKNAVFDAMFTDAWDQLGHWFDEMRLPTEPRRRLLEHARSFCDFSLADPARYQLMNQPGIPGFTPSDAGYSASLRQFERLRTTMADVGIVGEDDVDLWTALISGLLNQQLANDPGGDRWRRHLPRLVDMFCDEVGIPGPALRRKS